MSADSRPVEPPVIPHSHGSTSIIGKPVKVVASAALTSLAVAPKKPKTARGPTLGEVGKKERGDDDAALMTLNNSSPCVVGEFRSALETLFEALLRRKVSVYEYVLYASSSDNRTARR
jgi:hypothetical protein